MSLVTQWGEVLPFCNTCALMQYLPIQLDTETITVICVLSSIGVFQCNDGRTIDASLQCNGRFDCSDGSDEANCKLYIVLLAGIVIMFSELIQYWN